MNNKTCSECGINSFYAKGLCKRCYDKEYYQQPEVIVRRKKYYQQPVIKERYKKLAKDYNQQPEVKERIKQYNQQPEVKEKAKEYYQQNKERAKEYRKKYDKRPEVKERVKKYHKEHFKYKYKNNINFRIRHCLGSRLQLAIKNSNSVKSSTTMKLVGCSINELLIHLEKQFDERMNWQNMGKNGWVIDHIQPCCSFDLAKEEEQKKCFHYTNFRPLWEKDNQKKAIEDRKSSIRNKDV